MAVSTDIRKYLRANPDGATAATISEALHRPSRQVTNLLTLMPDTYRDRWVKSGDVWAAVWVAVTVPEDCPRPESKRKAKA